jgi:hypothetical protein
MLKALQNQRMKSQSKEGTRHLMSSFLLSEMTLSSLRIKERSSSRFVSCRTGLTRNRKTWIYSNKPSRASVRSAHLAGELARELATSTVASTMTGWSTPVFARASQNIVVAAMLLRNMPEPSNPNARRAQDEIRELLETTTMQQAESSASRRREAASERIIEPSR